MNYRHANLQDAPILIDIQQQEQAWMQQRKLIPLAFPDMGAVPPPIQVGLTECLSSDISENAASFAYRLIRLDKFAYGYQFALGFVLLRGAIIKWGFHVS